MYEFKLKNGRKVKHVAIDGYLIGDITLENILINISFNRKGYIMASINEKDRKYLEEVGYEHFLIEAQLIAFHAIKNKDYHNFITPSPIVDIIDEYNNSYYSPHPLMIKNSIFLSVRPICTEALIENIKMFKR